MDTSGSYSPAGETVTLSNFFCHGENLFIEVETTAPPPKRRSKRRRFGRSRGRLDLSADGDASGGGAGQRLSASSRDGGDEYSSEASEYDTYGTIPAWIKQELHDVPDDESDQSDDDVTTKATNDGHDSSMSSIHINKDLKSGQTAVKKPSEGGTRTKGEAPRQQHHRTSSTESGVDVAADHLSSSSSEPGSSGSEEKATAASGGAAKPAGPPRKVMAPQPFKSKMGAHGQKPLNRIRAQNKATRPRQGPENKERLPPKSGDSAGRSSSHSNTQDEVRRLREEKERTEAKLRRLEDEQRRRAETQQRDAERHANEREAELKEEIVHLRDELRNQSEQMKSNLDMVRDLQSKLQKVQSDQHRINSQPSPSAKSRQDTRKSVQRESKICSVQ